MLTRLRSLRRDERGVSAVIVAVCLIALFGAAVISVDAGSLWQTRRQAITGTDAGALAEAKALAFMTVPVACTGAYQTSINKNIPANLQLPLLATDGLPCTLLPGPNVGTGVVTVQARQRSLARFSGVFGIGDQQAFSLSAAQFGYPDDVLGLRPIGICKNSEHMLEWRRLKGDATAGAPMTQAEYDNLPIADPGVDGDDPPDGLQGIEVHHWFYPDAASAARKVVHRIPFNKDEAEVNQCGEDPGNWGWLDLDGGSNSTADLVDWLLDGFDDFVKGPGCTDDGSGVGCAGDPGSGGSNPSCGKNQKSPADALQCLMERQTEFPIVMYDSPVICTGGVGPAGDFILAQGQGKGKGSPSPSPSPSPTGSPGPGGGNNCTYPIYQMFGVIVRGFDLSGAQSERYIDFEFTNLNVEGGCCRATPPNFDSGLRTMQLCGVDHDNADALVIAQRCAFQM